MILFVLIRKKSAQYDYSPILAAWILRMNGFHETGFWDRVYIFVQFQPELLNFFRVFFHAHVKWFHSSYLVTVKEEREVMYYLMLFFH